jgi:hypothetical protein
MNLGLEIKIKIEGRSRRKDNEGIKGENLRGAYCYDMISFV